MRSRAFDLLVFPSMSPAARRLHSLAATLTALPSISEIPFLDSWLPAVRRQSFEKSLANCETSGHSRQLSARKRWREIMIHLIWYIILGLIAGLIAKSVLHVHMTIFWTIVLGIIGSIIGGAVTHMFSPPTGRFHPAGIIFSTLGAILVLFICLKLHIRFPRVL
jgi:uncharacterized membrane protein YeaQ/YmgE (transglycosylase-associated protein family)